MNPTYFRFGWLGLCLSALVLAAVQPAVAAGGSVTRRTALLGQDGDRTVVTREVLNHFAELAADALPGSTRLQVSDLALLPGIEAGDVIFIIQMQGAVLETLTDSARYGEVLFDGGAGRYEWLEVTGVDAAARTLQVRGRGPGSGLLSGYSVAGHTQVIQVPQFKRLSIASGGVLTAPTWNGATGGVLVVTAETLRLDGTVDMTGKGFRGGRVRQGGSVVAHGFRTTDAGLGAERGEGIGGFAAAFDLRGGRYGRGAGANGGGGGNAWGAAGGGGANGSEQGRSWTGLGVMDVSTDALRTAWRLDPGYDTALERFADDAGGGRGGYGCSSAEANPLVLGPEMGSWGCGDRAAVGGLGGRPLLEEAPGHLFLGGGGGAGHSDEGDAGAGGPGGGLVFILARSIEGEGLVQADGAAGGDAGLMGRRGGPGGGGGGGSVVLMATEGMSAVRVSAMGGRGGVHHAPESSSEASGGGGGGGGGVVVLVGAGEPRSSVAGGQAGTTTQPLLREMPTNGATGGGGGSIRRLPGFGPELAPPVFAVDLQVSLELGALMAPDYTSMRVYATVTNLGPERAENATVTFEFPPPLSGRPADDTLACEGSDSTLVCTVPGLEAGEETVLEVEMTLPPAAFSVRATASGGGFEVDSADNRVELSTKGPGSLQLRGGCSLADGSGAELGPWGVLVCLLGAGMRRGRRVASGWRRAPGTCVLPLCFAVLMTAGRAGAVSTNNAAPVLRFARDLRGDFALIGNTLAQNCGSATPLPLIGRMPPMETPVPGEASCFRRDSSPDFFWTLDDWTSETSGASTLPYFPPDLSKPSAVNPSQARSQAVLTLPPGARVTYARLYWAATRFNSSAGDKIANPDLTATLSRPGVAGFEKSLTADDSAFQYTEGSQYQYQSTADITDIVKAYGPGAYQVGDVQAIPLDVVIDEHLFDAWWMVVFYEVPGAPRRQLKLFDSMRLVDVTSGTELLLDGFHVPSHVQDAKLGVIAFEGDVPDDINDTLTFKGTPVGNALNPANNFFNGTRSWSTKNTGVSTDTPLTGADRGRDSLPISNRGDRPQLTGTPGSMSGLDLDVVDVTVSAGDHSATVKVDTGGDKFWLGGIVSSITTQAPDFTQTVKMARSLYSSDGTVRSGDVIEYTVSTINTGDDDSLDTVLRDPLPPQFDYIPGSLRLLSVAASDTTTVPVALTDARGDDVGEYDASTHTLTVYLGTGATPSKGGSLKGIVKAGDVGESTRISFQMRVKPGTEGKVENQAFITASGMLGIDPVKTPSRSPAGSGPTTVHVTRLPTPVITSPAPGGFIADGRPTFSGTAWPGTTVTVTDSGTVVCTAKTNLSGTWSCMSLWLMSEGPHTVMAAVTGCSSVLSLPATTTFTVDTLAPAQPVITAPASGATLTLQHPTFTGTAESNSRVTVSVDGKVMGSSLVGSSGNWSVTAPEPLADGSLRVSATAKDAAGNISTASSVSFTLAANPPDTTLTAGPPLQTMSSSATFDFTSPGPGIAGYECSLDGWTFVSCGSPKTYSDLSDGTHTFAVRARSSSGALDSSPETYTWMIGVDSDGDGIPDGIEIATSTDPADDDSDDDGILDGNEDADHDGAVDPGETEPRRVDSDYDGLQDGTEMGLNRPQGTGTNLAIFISDSDVGITTTNPLDADSDDGGVADGAEDLDHDGHVDLEETDPNNLMDDKVATGDTDGDGIPDSIEVITGTDPADDDSDDDGILDGNEDLNHDGFVNPCEETNPRWADTDGDGLQDGTETGLSIPQGPGTDLSVFQPDLDPLTRTAPLLQDTDAGGLPDGIEDSNHNGRVDPGELNPLMASDDRKVSPGDLDGDGLLDSLERATGTDPLDDDSDEDGLLDGNEDADRDGLVDPEETDPREADSDGDGLQDGTEAGLTGPQGRNTDLTRFLPDADPSTTTEPLRADTDDGGLADGREDANHNGRRDPRESDARNPTDDLDADGDGLSNSTEWELGLDAFDGDTDDDGILDAVDGLHDSDGDGLLDALDPDSDEDGVRDGTEVGVTLATVSHWTELHSPHFVPDGDPATTTEPRLADTDGDGLTDGEEDRDQDGVFDPEQGETRPTDPDTDKGGVSDGKEVQRGRDPLDGMDDQFISGGSCGATGNSLGGPWLMLLLGVPLRRWWRSRGRRSGSALGAVVLLGVLLAGTVHAQRLPGTSEAIDAQQYKPAPGPWDVLGLSSPRMAEHGEANLGFSFSYAKAPLGFRMTDTGVISGGLLEYQATADVMGALSFCGRFELGLSLPVTLQRAAPSNPALSEGGSGVGVGDVRLVSKMRVLSTEGGLHLGLLAPVLLPTAGGKALRGGSGVGLRPRLLAEWERGRVRLLANVGFNLQREESLYNLVVGNELAYGLGTEVSFSLGTHRLAADAMLMGARGLTRTTGAEARPLELMAAVKYHLTDALAVHAGAGPGLSRGYGTPVYRAFLGLRWTAGD